MLEPNLRPYQTTSIQELRQGVAKKIKRQVLMSPTGCHAKGTSILNAHGRPVPVETLNNGDYVMGPDSQPRKILALHCGVDEMFRIVPVKGEPFIVNGDHILSVKVTNDGSKHAGKIENISVRQWLSSSNNFRHCRKLYRVGIDLPDKDVSIDPYLLGVMLGDGCIVKGCRFDNPDEEILDAVISICDSVGWGVTNYKVHGDRCPAFGITKGVAKKSLIELLIGYGLMGTRSGTKFIPPVYLFNSRRVRLEILAGLIDTDGHYDRTYDYISKSKQLAEDVAYLARSLGLAAYIKECTKGYTGFSGQYFRACISGDLDMIPCRVERKKANPRQQIKSVLVTGFTVESLGVGAYYGFECDGDHLYVMGDFTVTHNSGKTEIAMAVIYGAVMKGKRVVFLCNRINLVNQASRRFYKAGISHGIIQGSNTRQTDKQVIVASIQTVAKRAMPECDLLVIDEVHGASGSAEFRKVIFDNKDKTIIGLTATPWSKGMSKPYPELDDEPLFQRMVVATTIGELITQGFLVDCDIYAPEEPDMSGFKMKKNSFGEMDYSDMDVGTAVDKPKLIGGIVEHWLKLAKDTPTVCFASNISHSKHIVEEFRAAGVPAEHIDCYTDEFERAAILKRVETGDTMVISNVGILTEGWDFPACKTMILARPTRSLIRYIQMIGRVLRPHPSKGDRALVLDHSGTVSRLGFPTDDFPMELDDGKARDNKAQEKKELLPTVCHQCKFVKPRRSPVCPRCGSVNHTPTLEVEPGELKKLEKKEKVTMEDK